MIESSFETMGEPIPWVFLTSPDSAKNYGHPGGCLFSSQGRRPVLLFFFQMAGSCWFNLQFVL